VGQEVAVNGDSVTGMGNRTGGSELVQRKENGIAVAGSTTKRGLNPPPKKRAVSAVRKFPPGCGRSPASTTGSGDEVLPSEATPVNNSNADAFLASPVLGDSASPTLALEASSNKLESNRVVDDGHSKAHNRVQVWDEFASSKQQDGDQRNIVPKATPRNASDGKTKGKLSARKGKQRAQQVVDDKMKNKLDGSLQTSSVRTPLSNPIDAKTKVKRLDTDKMNAGLLGNAESSAGGKLRSETLLSAKKEAVCSNMNTKQNKFACKLKGDDIVKDNLHLSVGKPNLGKHGATDQIEEPSQIIVQALRAPDNCPWTRGRKYIASSSKSLVPRNKLKGKDAKDQRFQKTLGTS
jgi:euchromatic histone-lysine N-methyltransferase